MFAWYDIDFLKKNQKIKENFQFRSLKLFFQIRIHFLYVVFVLKINWIKNRFAFFGDFMESNYESKKISPKDFTTQEFLNFLILILI